MSKKDMLFYDSFYNKEDDTYNMKMLNTETGEMTVYREKNPKTDVYILKNGVPVPSYYKETQPLSDLDTHKVSYKWRAYDCARLLGSGNAFQNAVRNRQMKQTDIFLDRRLMGSDMDLENITIMKYLDSLGYEEKDGKKNYFDLPPIKNIRKGFYDIETDIMHTNERADQPIICSTYLDDATKTVEVYAHVREDFKGLIDVMTEEERFKTSTKECLKTLIEQSSLKGKAREKLIPIFLKYIEDMKINITWFKEEKDMIEYSWKNMIQDYKPHFLGIFNAVYDIGQTEMRADKLGIKKHKLFCHPEVGNKYYFNNRKEHPKAAFRRHDYASEAYTKITDTQINYFGLRPQMNLDSEAFNSVLNVEVGFGKLDYSHICDHIRHLPYLDYWVYLMYNIIDTVNMGLLDIKTQDISSLLTRRFMVRTEYKNIFSPMNCVTNTFYHLEKRFGYIMANDVNKYIMGENNERLIEIDEAIANTYDVLSNRIAIAGGLCSDPTKFMKICRSVIEGVDNCKYMNNVMDADAVSMYPMIIEHTNISKDSLDGRITKVVNNNGELDIEAIMLSFITKSPVEIGRRCFGLPNIETIMRELDPTLEPIPEIQSEPERELETFMIFDENLKKADAIRKLLSSFDKTKVNTGDVKAGVNSTSKHFHINNNKSIMKIMGSKYEIIHKGETLLSDYLNISRDEDHYIFSGKGIYFDNVPVYKKPAEYDLSKVNVVYSTKLDKEILELIDSKPLDVIRLELGNEEKKWKLDITSRSHVFLSDDVTVHITDKDLFIFEYKIENEVGEFEVKILTQTLQY